MSNADDLNISGIFSQRMIHLLSINGASKRIALCQTSFVAFSTTLANVLMMSCSSHVIACTFFSPFGMNKPTDMQMILLNSGYNHILVIGLLSPYLASRILNASSAKFVVGLLSYTSRNGTVSTSKNITCDGIVIVVSVFLSSFSVGNNQSGVLFSISLVGLGIKL